MKKKSILLTLLAVPLLLAAGIALFCDICRCRTYDSYAAFAADGGRMLYDPGDSTVNLRFLLRKVPFGKLYLYAFTLPEEQAAEFEQSLDQRFQLTPETAPAQGTPAYWYGKTAGECADENEGLDAIPLHLPFDRITDRDIRGATVIVWQPAGTGSRSSGVLTFPDTREYICFEYLSR